MSLNLLLVARQICCFATIQREPYIDISEHQRQIYLLPYYELESAHNIRKDASGPLGQAEVKMYMPHTQKPC